MDKVVLVLLESVADALPQVVRACTWEVLHNNWAPRKEQVDGDGYKWETLPVLL